MNDIRNLVKICILTNIAIVSMVLTSGCVGAPWVPAPSDISAPIATNCPDDGVSDMDRHNLKVNADTANDKVIFYENFEDVNYQARWKVHWGKPAGVETICSPEKYIHSGRRSAYTESRQGRHKSNGSGEYVPDIPIDDSAYVRLYLRLEDDFSMGRSREMKLFGIRGGATIEDTYGGAGKVPTGGDKFSVRLAIDNWQEIKLYYYHPGQRGRYGDSAYCQKFFCRAKISPGRWHCFEVMLKNNDPGIKNGMIKGWLNGKLILEVYDLRFRDVSFVKIRRFSIENYFGGGRKKDASPKNQRIYIDDFIISKERIGCL